MCMYTIVFLQIQTGGVFLGFVTNNSSEFPFTLHLFAFYYVHTYIYCECVSIVMATDHYDND